MKSASHVLVVATPLAIALGSIAPIASADIIEVGGAAVLAAPPASIQMDEWENNTEIRGFFERETTLVSDLGLDHAFPGLVDDESLVVPGVVAAGTRVQSYLFHGDSVDGADARLSGYVVFDTPILGVLFRSGALNGSDSFLGRPGVTYGTNIGRRLELPPGSFDTFEISADRLRLDFTLQFAQAYDEVRVITAVPSPATLPVMAALGLGAMRRRRA